MADNCLDSRCTTDSIETAVDDMRKIKLGDIVVDDSRPKIYNKLRNKSYYENVFTWDMRNASKNSENLILEFETIDKLRKSLLKQSEMVAYENGMELFNLHKYCYKLILCYELFINEKYNESLLEVEDLVEYLKNITFDKSNGQYITAYNHMVLSTYVYILISMNFNNSYEKIVENLKLLSELNNTEKSAIHAVKALIFMKYPSLSKHIAFNEATEAYKLNSTDAEWIHVWLMAKGPLNREFNNFKEPDDNELKIAEDLLSLSKSFWHLMSVTDVFFKVYKYTNVKVKKEKYLKLTLKNMLMAIELAGNNGHLVIKCLKFAIDQPILLLPTSIIEEKIKIVHDFEHSHVNGLIGNYYLRHKKDETTAKKYFLRGKDEDVLCVLKMLKIECNTEPLNELDEIPVIETLTDAYNIFSNSKSRVKLLSQILLYLTYFKEKHDKILHYFKLFMDLPFDNAFKYRHLISIIPIFKIKNFHHDQFVQDLSNNIEYIIKNYDRNSNEKKILYDTLQRFSKMVIEAFNDTYLKTRGLNANVQSKLNIIMSNYESIFSWKIKLLTGHYQNLMLNFMDRIREKLDNCLVKDDEFSEYRFYHQLIIIYELFNDSNYNESLIEINNTVRYLQSCKFNEADEQYVVVYNHIAQATYGFIALTLNLDFEMENIKDASSFNEVQKSAICALKARVFLEYSPKGNDIALVFSEQALNLNPTETNCIAIWLKAKGKVRRHYQPNNLPDTDELNAAEFLCSVKTLELLIQVSMFYSETAYCYKYKKEQEESDNYYQLSSDIILRVIKLAQDDIQHLSACLLVYVEYPTKFQSNSIMENLIQKLLNVKNNRCLDCALGMYYYKIKKDYEKAKIYLARRVAGGSFRCALKLINVECHLQPVDKFPLVQTLNMIYDHFPCYERRLIILTQILMYYYYYCLDDNNSIMHYLKLYLDQDVEDTLKKHYLINAFPRFKINGYFKQKTFFDVLFLKVKYIKENHTCSIEEKETLDRFDKLSKLNLYENQLFNDKKIDVHNQNYNFNANSNQQYPKRKFCSNRNYEFRNWRKQPYTNIDLNYSREIHVCSWRNQKNRSKNESKPTQADTNWRFQNKDSNDEQVFETNVVFGKGKAKYT